MSHAVEEFNSPRKIGQRPFEWESLLQAVASSTSAQRRLGRFISGEVATSPSTLMIAQCEGRNYFRDLRTRQLEHAKNAVAAAERLRDLGFRMRNLDLYKSELAEIEKAHQQ